MWKIIIKAQPFFLLKVISAMCDKTFSRFFIYINEVEETMPWKILLFMTIWFGQKQNF